MKAVALVGTSLVALGMLLVASHAGEAAQGKKPDKEVTLTVTETPHQFFPGGPTILTWAFNGTVPGPELRVRQGERVRVTFRNETNSEHTIHFHGLHLPNNMDGVPGISQDPVPPGGTFVYDFVARTPGTHMYHCHVNSPHHVDMGMYGAFIVEPKDKRGEPRVDKDVTLMLDEWIIDEDSGDHATMSHPRLLKDANYFTINGKSFPATAPLKVKEGERIRIRLINIGYLVHSMHIHGHGVEVTHMDGHRLREPLHKDTILIGPGERYDFVFTADNPGTWLFHDHIIPFATNDGEYPGGLVMAIVYEGKAAAPAKHKAH
ncbi:MAG: multicopper oxidase family protein [Candidatus Methylomirabilales bacterium]